jgi:putative transposase
VKSKKYKGPVHAFRYELDPNGGQKVLFAKGCGIRRSAWNWGLGKRIALLRTYPPGDPRRYTSAEEQHKAWNATKATERPWCYEVSKCAGQEALRDLERAFKRYYDGRSGKGPTTGFPRFKPKYQRERFRIPRAGASSQSLRLEGRSIVLPMVGAVRLKEQPDTESKRTRNQHFQGRILSATVRKVADRWYVSVSVALDKSVPARPVEKVAGVDLGLKTFAVVGELGGDGGDALPPLSIAAPKPLKAALGKLRRAQRKVARRDTWAMSASKKNPRKKRRDGTQNRIKAVRAVARQHARVANVRRDFLQKTTTKIGKSYDAICIEDLSVRWILKNERLALAASDLGLYEYRRQLDYKQRLLGFRLIVAPRTFPSTQRCSRCGAIKCGADKLTLADRTYVCAHCGFVIDRDDNASLNLAWYGGEVIAGRIAPSSLELPRDEKLACLEELPLPDELRLDRASRPPRPRMLPMTGRTISREMS